MKSQACEQAAQELSEYGECIALPGDVGDADSRRQLCEQLAAKETQLNILVNNAGTAWGADYEDFPESAFDKVMRVNVTAMFALTRDFTPLLDFRDSLPNIRVSRVYSIRSVPAG